MVRKSESVNSKDDTFSWPAAFEKINHQFFLSSPRRFYFSFLSFPIFYLLVSFLTIYIFIAKVLISR